LPRMSREFERFGTKVVLRAAPVQRAPDSPLAPGWPADLEFRTESICRRGGRVCSAAVRVGYAPSLSETARSRAEAVRDHLASPAGERHLHDMLVRLGLMDSQVCPDDRGEIPAGADLIGDPWVELEPEKILAGGAIRPPPFGTPALACSACGRTSPAPAVFCDCQGSVYCSEACKAEHWPRHAATHAATLALAAEGRRVKERADESARRSEEQLMYADSESDIRFGAAHAASLGMEEVRRTGADDEDDAAALRDLDVGSPCSDLVAERVRAPAMIESGTGRVVLPAAVVERREEAAAAAVPWAAYPVRSERHPEAVCFRHMLDAVGAPRGALGFGGGGMRFAPGAWRAGWPAAPTPRGMAPMPRGAAAGMARPFVPRPYPRVPTAMYPWHRPMPYGCYRNPLLCTLAYSAPIAMGVALGAAMAYPLYAPYAARWGTQTAHFSRVMLPYGYPQLFDQLPAPPHYGDPAWQQWWAALITLAHGRGMVEAVPGKPDYVRWVSPAYGVQAFYWIPPSFRPYIEQSWAMRQTPAARW